jgi:hypothetical protein
MFSVLTEAVYIYLPGRNPMNFYLCLGSIDADVQTEQGAML